MKITITHPVKEHGFQAGQTVEVSDALAKQLIDFEWAFEVKEVEKPVYFEPKRKKVKHDDR